MNSPPPSPRPIPPTAPLPTGRSPLSAFRLPPPAFCSPLSAFTLFEVLVAMGVFVIAVTGLALALESAVQAAFEARERALCRVALESRLAVAMADPPNGRRIIEARDNHGIRVEETLEPFEARTTNGTPITGLYTLKITADFGKHGAGKESAEILLYKP